MVKNIIFIFLVTLIINTSYSQREINNLPKSISVFIPKGYKVLDTAYGNLNLDDVQDLILVLKSPIEDKNDEDTIRRPLLILFGQKNGSFQFKYRNDNVVFCRTCGNLYGDPYMDIKIKNGFFTVEHYGGSNWRWTDYITFKFDKNDNHFYFHREELSSYHINKPDKVKTTTKTKKEMGVIEFEKYTSAHK